MMKRKRIQLDMLFGVGSLGYKVRSVLLCFTRKIFISTTCTLNNILHIVNYKTTNFYRLLHTKRLRLRTVKGFSLTELVVAISLFSIVATSLTFFSVTSLRSLVSSKRRFEAQLYLQELFQAITQKKQENWNVISSNTGSGPKKLVFSGSTYSLIDGSVTKNGITTSVTLQNVYRDASGNIAASGTIDTHSRLLTLTATWLDGSGQTKTISQKSYITDWTIIEKLQTTFADFNPGTQSGVAVTNSQGGEVVLSSAGHGNWCAPNLSINALDLPGNGIANAVYAIPGKAFVVTGNNASGNPYSDVNITNTTYPTPPVATVGSSYTASTKSNAIFGETGYAYLGTDTNSKEVDILNTNTNPPTEVGYFNAPGSGSGDSVYVSGNIGYMTSGSKFYTFNLSAKTGSRAQIGSVTIAGTASKMVVKTINASTYAFVAITGSATTKLQIINVTNPSSPAITSSTNTSSGFVTDIFVNDTASRAYLSTAASPTQPEMFILDISNKNAPAATIGTYEANGMNPRGITVVPGNRAILVGSGGEQYQVIDTTFESSPTRCGGMNIPSGINGVATVFESDGDAFSYIITNDSNSEFKMIAGGSGGTSYTGSGAYSTTGTYTSPALDFSAAYPTYINFGWTSQLPAGTLLKIQIRTADTETGLGSATWFGPGGSSTAYFTDPLNASLSTIQNINKRYLQYKVSFTSDGGITPVFTDITIYYQI